jgi:hypothetical protein
MTYGVVVSFDKIQNGSINLQIRKKNMKKKTPIETRMPGAH